MYLSIVISLYNEKENVLELTKRLINSLNALGLSFEIIYVIDGDDGSYEILKKHVGSNVILDYSKKCRGFKNSFLRGFSLVNRKSEFVLTMDGDLNHQPEEIVKLIKVINSSGSDIAIGSRYVFDGRIENLSLWKRWLSKIANLVTILFFDLKIKDKTSGFRIYKKKVIDAIAFKCISDGFEFLFEIIVRARRKGYKIVEIPIIFKAREKGKSKFKVIKTIRGYVNLLFMDVLGRLK